MVWSLVPTLRVGTRVPDALRPSCSATPSVAAVWSHAERGTKTVNLKLILPQFPVHELLDLHPFALGVLAHVDAVLLNKRLLEQHLLGVEILQPPFDHLVDDIRGLAFV